MIKGVSHSTGESGYFSPKSVERSVESDTWRVHKSQVLVQQAGSGNVVGLNTNANGVNSGGPVSANSPKTANQGIHQQLHQMSMSSMQPSAQSSQQPTRTTVSYMEKQQPVKNAGQFSNMYSENLTMQKRFQANPHRSIQVDHSPLFSQKLTRLLLFVLLNYSHQLICQLIDSTDN